MKEGTRTGEVMDTIRRRIAGRTLAPGERLPSVRRLAATMGVSPSTVVVAYARLAADGQIRSRPGSGFYVADATAPLVLAEAGPPLEREVDPLWVSRQSLDAGDGADRPGCGWLPPEWMPEDIVRRAVRAAVRGEAALLSDYGGVRGSPRLRGRLARQFADDGLVVDSDRILLTVSGTQAVDLVCRFLLRPGDVVIVDDPCYFNFRALLRVHGVEVIGVPYTPTGPDVVRFAEALERHSPRLYLTNSALHNPTGATISPRTAHAVLAAATAHDVTIVEDDIFAPFEPDPSPRIASLDGLERVIRIGSFSKSLSASLRCGYIAARPDWIEALIDLQVATHFGGPSPFVAEAVHLALGDAGFARHMNELRRRLARARREAIEQLGRLGIVPWTTPRGGFYLWCELPDGADATVLAREALAEGVVLAPGDVFSPSRTMNQFLRFNVGQMPNSQAFEFLSRAAPS